MSLNAVPRWWCCRTQCLWNPGRWTANPTSNWLHAEGKGSRSEPQHFFRNAKLFLLWLPWAAVPQLPRSEHSHAPPDAAMSPICHAFLLRVSLPDTLSPRTCPQSGRPQSSVSSDCPRRLSSLLCEILPDHPGRCQCSTTSTNIPSPSQWLCLIATFVGTSALPPLRVVRFTSLIPTPWPAQSRISKGIGMNERSK